jgi:hypothetical protein
MIHCSTLVSLQKLTASPVAAFSLSACSSLQSGPLGCGCPDRSPEYSTPEVFECRNGNPLFFQILVMSRRARTASFCQTTDTGSPDSIVGFTAMTTQNMLTYGLSRSPIREHFQNIPVMLFIQYDYLTRGKRSTYPSLFLSMIPGKMEWTYVDVQMKSRMTRSNDWKLNMAVCCPG